MQSRHFGNLRNRNGNIGSDRLTHQAVFIILCVEPRRRRVLRMISAEHIKKAFDDREVLCDISFHIPQGEIFGLLGPSGSGKTALIKILTGQLPPSDGKCTMHRRDFPAVFCVPGHSCGFGASVGPLHFPRFASAFKTQRRHFHHNEYIFPAIFIPSECDARGFFYLLFPSGRSIIVSVIGLEGEKSAVRPCREPQSKAESCGMVCAFGSPRSPGQSPAGSRPLQRE